MKRPSVTARAASTPVVWKVIPVTLTLLFLFLVPGDRAPALAAGSEAGSGEPVAATDLSQMESFLDEFLPGQMEELGVPGLVFVMVRDGEVALAKGYGYADRERQIPYDPAQTIVRAGSIVKLITATALMQLAEQGGIDLDRDVNDYLTSLQVPDTYEDPITARQLLHYTGGLDARFIGIRVGDPGELMSLSEYMSKHLAPRVRPPGVLRAYNDQEISLAALVLEEASGASYDEYVGRNLFEPLGMDSSSLVLSEGQTGRAAIGYSASGPYPANYYYLNNAAGAGFNSTALDLANFMIMHLQDGEFEGRQVLAPSTVQAMHETGFRHHPALPGIAYAFDETLIGDLRILAKSGGAPGFQNRMILIPDENVGIYFSYNRDSSVNLRGRLEDAILEEFFTGGAEQVSVEPMPEAAARTSRYVGTYQDLNDLSLTTVEKVSRIMDQFQVTANGEGSLNLSGRPMVEVEPGLFRRIDTGSPVAFRENGDGEVTHLFIARTAFEKVPWTENATLHMALAAIGALAFLTGAVAWVIAVLRRKGRARRLSGVVSLLGLAFLVGFAVIFAPLASSPDPPWQFSFAPSLELRVVLGLTVPLAILIGVLGIATIRDWLKGNGSAATRIHNSVIAVAGLGFVFFLHTWNLLGWRF